MRTVYTLKDAYHYQGRVLAITQLSNTPHHYIHTHSGLSNIWAVVVSVDRCSVVLRAVLVSVVLRAAVVSSDITDSGGQCWYCLQYNT